MEDPKSQNRRTKYPILILLTFFCLFLLIYGRPVIESDGITYYALALSLLEDHDFDLTNQYQKMPEVRLVQNRNTRRPASMYSAGFALLYDPFIWTTRGIGRLFPGITFWRPYAQSARFPITDALGIFVGSAFYSLVSILVTVRLLMSRFSSPTGVAVLLSLTVFVGTSMAFYTFCSPSFIHAADSFLIAFVFYLTVMPRPSSPARNRIRNAMIGFLLALSLFLRNNNVVLIPPFVAAVLFFQRKEGWKSAMIACLEILLGALPILLIHIYYNWIQYGQIVATGYRVDLSETGFARKLKALSRLDRILVNPSAGMFVWSPITFLSVVGLVLGSFRRRPESILALICVILVVASIRFAGFAWTGASFGQRYILHLFVFFVVGLYELTVSWKRTVIVLSVVCALWSFVLWNAYLINFASPKFRGTLTIQRERELTPVMLLRNTSSEYETATESKSIKNPFAFWWDSLGSKPYPTLIHLWFDKDGMRKQDAS